MENLQIMASSLNGLKVGDPMSINLMDSSARSEIICILREFIVRFQKNSGVKMVLPLQNHACPKYLYNNYLLGKCNDGD